jgi:hypothetical protein
VASRLCHRENRGIIAEIITDRAISFPGRSVCLEYAFGLYVRESSTAPVVFYFQHFRLCGTLKGWR